MHSGLDHGARRKEPSRAEEVHALRPILHTDVAVDRKEDAREPGVSSQQWLAAPVTPVCVCCSTRQFRDVKPANFCIGRGRHGTRQLFIVDFGTARNLNRKLNAELELPEPRFHGFCGTLRYASLGVHDRGAQVIVAIVVSLVFKPCQLATTAKDLQNVGKVDDLWSAYYLTVENANGQLPWRYINDRPLVANMKRTVLNSAVIMNQAPHPWFDFVQQPKSVQLMLQTLVQYTQHSTPDYSLLVKHIVSELNDISFL